MHIEVTFGGALTRYLPEDTKGNHKAMETDNGVTLSTFLVQVGIEESERLLVILNGKLVHQADFPTTQLYDRDSLSLMPPIQAG